MWTPQPPPTDDQAVSSPLTGGMCKDVWGRVMPSYGILVWCPEAPKNDPRSDPEILGVSHYIYTRAG